MYHCEKLYILQEQIKNSLELNNVNISNDIQISTMTLEAKINTRFYPWNIYKYIKKSADGIVKVVKENRNKVKKTCKTKNKNRQSDVFLNQVTVSIKVSNKINPVSVKIFNSGTMHFTGCVRVDNMLEAVYKLCIECRKCRAIILNDGTIKEIEFAENINNLSLENLYDFKVDMINCIFKVPFTIDRPKLQILLKSENYNAVYDSNGHAAVKIKFVDTKKKITIFIFESGSIIIILGNQGFNKIKEVYIFIYTYLLENYHKIVKNDELVTSSIIRYINNEKEKLQNEKYADLKHIDINDDTEISDTKDNDDNDDNEDTEISDTKDSDDNDENDDNEDNDNEDNEENEDNNNDDIDADDVIKEIERVL